MELYPVLLLEVCFVRGLADRSHGRVILCELQCGYTLCDCGVQVHQ